MGAVRAMEPRDLPKAAALYERVVGVDDCRERDRLRTRLLRVFREHPWGTERHASRVFEERGGAIVGCLGVVPRPMQFKDRTITVVTSHTFLVESSCRSSMAALHLIRSLLDGPQDLSLCQGNDAARRIWEAAGGTTSQVYSLCWTRPLRPLGYALSCGRRRGLPRSGAWLASPFAAAADMLLRRAVPSAFGIPAPAGDAVEMDPEEMVRYLPRITSRRKLRPLYRAGDVVWLMETLETNPARGRLRKSMVRAGGRVAGWYVYQLSSGGIAEVAQIAATDATVDVVLDHLFAQAYREGALAISGQVDPLLFRGLAGRQCLFHHENDSWVLVHSRDPEIREAINDGSAFLSRMDGEWWISELLR
jgi:hypothetical protein